MVPVVALSAKDYQKLTKLLNKGFERSVYWKECKTKSKNKNMTTEYRYFLESNFVAVKRLFVLVHSNQDAMLKDLKLKDIFYQKELLIVSRNAIINGKTFMINHLILI